MKMNPERMMKNESSKRFFEWLSVMIFALLMIGGTVLGCILILRPKVSEIEKRELTRFPEFTLSRFLEGEFTSEAGSWYADTFPFRDSMIDMEQKIKLSYGIRTNTVSHVAEGDDIPDLPGIDDDPSMPDPSGTGQETEAPPMSEEPEEPTRFEDNGEELTRMNPQEAGQVNIKDLVGYCVYGFNLRAANTYCDSVSALGRTLSSYGIRTYEILVPNNSAITLDDGTRTEWNLSDEKKVIRYYYGKTNQLNPDIRNVDIFEALLEHKEEYIYFKTDHHWTALGAYYAYREYCEAAGLTPNPLSSYRTEISPVFTGSYITTNGFRQLESNPDSITYYYPHSTNSIRFFDEEQGGFREGNAIRNLKDYNPRYGYMGFIYGDHAISYMENPEIQNGRVCLVVKESFGNCFAPFLIDHYERVIIVDYRYYQDLISKVAVEEGVTDVVFLNNLDAISDNHTMQVLNDRCK